MPAFPVSRGCCWAFAASYPDQWQSADNQPRAPVTQCPARRLRPPVCTMHPVPPVWARRCTIRDGVVRTLAGCHWGRPAAAALSSCAAIGTDRPPSPFVPRRSRKPQVCRLLSGGAIVNAPQRIPSVRREAESNRAPRGSCGARYFTPRGGGRARKRVGSLGGAWGQPTRTTTTSREAARFHSA